MRPPLSFDQLKPWLMGSPIVVAVVVLGAALLDKMQGREDVILVLVATGTVLLTVEWSLGRRFKRHETWEKNSQTAVIDAITTALKEEFTRALVTADSAAEAAHRADMSLKSINEGLDALNTRMSNFDREMAQHDSRLRAIEERLARASLMRPPT